jgi:hypothetical protein
MSFQGHPNITRRLLTAFMEFFTYVELERYSSSFTQRKLQKVPIQYCATDKWFQIYNSSSARKQMNMDNNIAPVEMQWVLPRLSVNLMNIVYDTERHLNKGIKLPSANDTAGQRSTVYAPVPYNLEIELSAIAKNIDDIFQIMEQIIPYFSPTMSIDVKITDDITDSVAVGLNSVSFDFPQEVNESEERLFIVTYGFTMRGNYYFDKQTGKIITTTFNNLSNPTLDTNVPIGIDGTQTLFAQFVNNSYNPNPTDAYASGGFRDTDQVALKNKGDWTPNPVTPYKNFDFVRYGTNKFIWIGGASVNIEPSKPNWESCWTLLSVIQNSSLNVLIDDKTKEEFLIQ